MTQKVIKKRLRKIRTPQKKIFKRVVYYNPLYFIACASLAFLTLPWYYFFGAFESGMLFGAFICFLFDLIFSKREYWVEA